MHEVDNCFAVERKEELAVGLVPVGAYLREHLVSGNTGTCC